MDNIKLTSTLLLILLVSFVAGCVILYFIIKWAIKDAFTELRNKSFDFTTQHKTSDISNDSTLNPLQRELKRKYEKGEITLEEYQSKWNQIVK